MGTKHSKSPIYRTISIFPFVPTLFFRGTKCRKSLMVKGFMTGTNLSPSSRMSDKEVQTAGTSSRTKWKIKIAEKKRTRHSLGKHKAKLYGSSGQPRFITASCRKCICRIPGSTVCHFINHVKQSSAHKAYKRRLARPSPCISLIGYCPRLFCLFYSKE